MNFQDKVAIITGGTGALGSTLVQRFLSEGASVAVPVHQRSSADIQGHSGTPAEQRLFLVAADLLLREDVDRFVRQVVSRWKKVDFLIHTVGTYAGGKRVEEISDEEWDHLMDLNLMGAFRMCRAVLPLMRERGFGRIITIGAMAALRPTAKRGPYQVSKRALITLTETIAEEVKGSGITANAIVPSTILTPDNLQSMPDADHAKWVTPGEIADLVRFLCQAETRSVNGNAIKIYGGV